MLLIAAMGGHKVLQTRDVTKYTMGQKLQSRQGVAGGLVTAKVVSIVADDGSEPPRGKGRVTVSLENDGDYETFEAPA